MSSPVILARTLLVSVIEDPDSTIAIFEKAYDRFFDGLLGTNETAKIMKAFTNRWAISSYEKVLRNLWAKRS